MIRSAKEIDIPQLLEITGACAVAMQQKNIYQWTEAYPDAGTLLRDISRKELWVLEENLAVVGCVVLSAIMDNEYKSVPWPLEKQEARYVHRLAVHPNLQRKGLGGKLMAFAENQAKKQGALALRLDTFSRNARNQQFYEARGYRRCGTVYFPNQSAYPFYCYELPLF